jgi:hypothetical protein
VATADQIIGINSVARNRALKSALAVVGLLGLTGVFLSLLLPDDKERGSARQADEEAA